MSVEMHGEATCRDEAHAERLAARFGLPGPPNAHEIVGWENGTRDLYACGYALSTAAALAAIRSFRGVAWPRQGCGGVALCTLLPLRALQLARPA